MIVIFVHDQEHGQGVQLHWDHVPRIGDRMSLPLFTQEPSIKIEGIVTKVLWRDITGKMVDVFVSVER